MRGVGARTSRRLHLASGAQSTELLVSAKKSQIGGKAERPAKRHVTENTTESDGVENRACGIGAERCLFCQTNSELIFVFLILTRTALGGLDKGSSGGSHICSLYLLFVGWLPIIR